MMDLPRCCMDFEIKLEHLIFPERLPADGLEFLKLHGADSVPLQELRAGAIDRGDGMVRIMHRCSQLQDDGSCRIYENRPGICKNFDCATRADCACGGKGWRHA